MNNDLFSRKALLERIEKDTPWWWQNFHSYLIVDMLEEAPAIEAEPVRHGKWLYVGYGKPDAWDCSECSVMVAKQHFYCPRCGAKMDGGKNDAETGGVLRSESGRAV